MTQEMHITGFVAIIVDSVDIDQAEIESPAILRESPSIKAMVAARGKESFISMRRICEKHNHVIEYQDYQQLPLGRIEVLFTIRKKTAQEITDAGE